MATINLTEKTLAAIEGTDKLVFHWDTNLAGFGLYVKGKARNYVVKGRVHGEQVMYTMGKCVLYKSVKAAREEAKELLQNMSKGINPKKEKEALKTAAIADKKKDITLSDILKSYLAERPNLKESSRKFYQLMLDTYLEDWKDRPIREIDYQDVKERHLFLSKKVEIPSKVEKKKRTEKKKIRRNGPGVANSAMKTMRVLFNHAISEHPEIISANPVNRLKTWNELKPRTGYLAEGQLPAWYKAVEASMNLIPSNVLLLLLFTGLRSKSEGFGLMWTDVDLEGKVMNFRDTKNGTDLELPITSKVAELLERMKSLRQNKFVFPSPVSHKLPDGKIVTGHVKDVLDELTKINEVAGVEITPHDLRRTFTTIAESLDISPYTIKALVNHSEKKASDVTGGYIQIPLERKRKALQMIEDEIMRIVAGTKSADVIPITRQAA